VLKKYNELLNRLLFIIVIPVTVLSQSTGIISDAIIIPPNYDNFKPPSNVGENYVDPAFGARITRISNTGRFDKAVIGGYFTNGEICYFNKDGSYFMASMEENIDGGVWITSYLFNGQTGTRLKALARGELNYWTRWPLANKYKKDGQYVEFDPNKNFYRLSGNEIRLYSTEDMSFQVIRRFSEYNEIEVAGGEGDISDDGRYWVLDGDAKELFAYDMIDNVKYPASGYDLGNLGSKGGAVGVDYACISPRGNYIIVSWGTDPGVGRYRGIEVYDKNWVFQRQVFPGIIHWEVGVDAFGEEVVYTAGTSGYSNFPPLEGIGVGDFISIRMRDGFVRLLKDMPIWAHFYMTACNSVTNQDYIYISLTGDRSKNPSDLWAPFWGEIVEVPTDGSGLIRRLAHHRSKKVEGKSGKFSQADAVVNRQGTKMIYRSTYGYDYGDLYIFDISPRDVTQVDDIPPLAPLEIDGAPGPNNIQLSWGEPDPAGDGDIPLFYVIYRDNEKVAEVYGLEYNDIGLDESTAYDYQIYSVDDANNRSIDPLVGQFSTSGDTTPPQLLSLAILNQEELLLKFSKALEQTIAETVENYQLNFDGQVYSATLVENKSVKLSTSFLTLGKEYELTVQNITDATSNNNPMLPVTKNFRLLKDFYQDFEAFDFTGWDFRTRERWQVTNVQGNNVLELNTSDYDTPGGKRLGEYALISAEKFIAQNFNLSCNVQSTDDLLTNPYADFAIVFNFIDEMNYYYMQFQTRGVALSQIIDGVRTESVVDWKGSFEPDKLNKVSVSLVGDLLTVLANDIEITRCPVSINQAGQIGFGSYNDAVQFDNINIGGNLRGDTTAPHPPDGLEISWK
jgi:hypothetical protein